MTPRMHCVALGCTQGVDSCKARHVAAREAEEGARNRFSVVGVFACSRLCATCGTGAAAANMDRFEVTPPPPKAPAARGGRNPTDFFEHNGERRSLREWGALYGKSADTLRKRINLGWTFERVLTRPLQQGRPAK